MKALTIHQPYATLIATGEKRVENREWSTKYRGPLVIHAGKSKDMLCWGEESDYVLGAIMGIATLVDVASIKMIKQGVYDHQYPWLRNHEHALGTQCWVLENVKRFNNPLPYKGAQGLWNIPDVVLEGLS